MDRLPNLCIDLIASFIDKDLPRDRLVRTAATVALVGNAAFTTLAHSLFEIIDPGCSTAAHHTHALKTEEHRKLCENLDAHIASAVPKPLQLSPGITETSKVVALKEECRRFGRFGCPLSARNKAAIWVNITAALEESHREYERAIQCLRERATKTPPKLPACFVRKEARKEIDEMRAKLITATRAKDEYLLSETDLDKLVCKLKPNPHYRSSAPMRLYRLVDVIYTAHTKYDGKLEEARAKRTESARKRVNKHAHNVERVRAALVTLGVDTLRLSGFSSHAVTLLQNITARNIESTVSRLHECWRRLIKLETALEQKGCSLRSDSRLCEAYIDYGYGDVVGIVKTMNEMRFFFGHTEYARLRTDAFTRLRDIDGMYDGISEDASDEAKVNALKLWVRQFASVEEACARPELPPSLLWGCAPTRRL